MDVTLRACRYPHRLRAWKRLPSGLFVSAAEPGVCVGAPPKEIRLAETQTVLKGEGPGRLGGYARPLSSCAGPGGGERGLPPVGSDDPRPAYVASARHSALLRLSIRSAERQIEAQIYSNRQPRLEPPLRRLM